MSLASSKQKAKGNRKVIPKLKTILANPFKSKCEQLDGGDIAYLQEILQQNIIKSCLKPRDFANERHINIGLGSVLRAINKSRVSCVLLALSIKPAHIINLIARNVEVKSPAAQIYGLVQLEQFTEQVFGVRALALSFPADVSQMDVNVREWVSAQQKRIKKQQTTTSTTSTMAIKHPTKMEVCENDANSDHVSVVRPSRDMECSTGAIRKASLRRKKAALVEMSVKINASNAELSDSNHKDTKINASNDYFDYKPLSVYKLHPNPNRLKKKRKK